MRSSRRASTFIFAFMAFILVVGAIAPLFQSNISAPVDTPPPTPVPISTFPAPVANLQSITLDRLYLHPTGLFAIAQPTGWEQVTPLVDASRAGVTMTNSAQLSVVETSVELPASPVTNLDELSARFDDGYLAGSWARYSEWEETARRTEGERLILDFNLTLNRQQYVARQISWTDGDWVYNVRLVTPSNATEMLVYVLNALADTLQPFKQFAGTPFDWLMIYDQVLRHVIRYPQAWIVADSAPGRPTSITSPDGAQLRLDAATGTTVADEAEAEAWVLENRPSATILSVEPAQRGDSAGFSVAYSFNTVDGDPQSGLALLLNGPEDTLHVANLWFPAANVDLNAVEAAPAADATAEATAAVSDFEVDYSVYTQILSTFSMLPPLNIVNVSATPTPLPPVTVSTPEATAEATTDVETAPTEEATEPAEADTDATPDATADATEAA